MAQQRLSFAAAVLLVVLAFVAAVFAQDEGYCHTIKAKNVCLSNSTCAWCTSAAVPSACFERDQTGKLPPSIFDCTNGTIAMA